MMQKAQFCFTLSKLIYYFDFLPQLTELFQDIEGFEKVVILGF